MTKFMLVQIITLSMEKYDGLDKCPTCFVSRWKKKNDGEEDRVGVLSKVLWYFSIIPRFKRMFQPPKIAEDLTWHVNGRIQDGKLGCPTGSPYWKLIDKNWPKFASEPRNLRLALSVDGSIHIALLAVHIAVG